MIFAAKSSSSLYWLSATTTPIHSEDDALTDGKEYNLQFHIEFGEIPPASSTVAFFEAYISDTNATLSRRYLARELGVRGYEKLGLRR